MVPYVICMFEDSTVHLQVETCFGFVVFEIMFAHSLSSFCWSAIGTEFVFLTHGPFRDLVSH